MILKYSLKSIASFVILLAIFISSSAQASGDKAVSQLMAKTAEPFISDKQIPGAAIALYYNGQDYYFNYGVADKNTSTPITENTIFELASITKVFVTTLLGIEVRAGKLKLTDPIEKYIPKLANTRGLPIDNVHVVNLATHTASFPRQMEQASLPLLSAMEFAQQPYFVVKPRFTMGLGWQRVKQSQGLFITKNGGNQGFSTFIGFSPSKKFGVVVLTNQSKGKATLLGNQILKGLSGL